MKDIFIILFNILAGSATLMFGVHMMSTSLEKSNFSKIKHFYAKKITPWQAFIFSILITALLQSSTAVSVVTIGLVNGGLINLETSLFIIYGANIGTTFTAQLISLDVTQYGVAILFLGIILYFLNQKTAGKVCIGIGFMFSGIQILHYSVAYIKNNERIFLFIKQYGGKHYILFVIGIFLTAIVQSSSAITGISIVLFNNNIIPLHAAASLILGDNIGTCITALAASVGGGINAKRAAWGHMIYNIIGSVCALLFLDYFIDFVMILNKIAGHTSASLVADVHTVFNIVSAVVFLPFTKYYAKLLQHMIQ